MPNIEECIAKIGKNKYKVMPDGTYNPFEPTSPPKKRYNTRIAPSPTGHAHLGTFRTAIFSYLAALGSGGKFYLRIDDTDTDRNQPEAIQPIYDALQWLNITANHLPNQSDRVGTYRQYAASLVSKGFAKELDNGAVSLLWHPEMPRVWKDNISGEIKITDTNIAQIDGFNEFTGKYSRTILLKGKEENFAPTYALTSMVDDYDFRINYIIRGTDHISNTPKQIALLWALDRLNGTNHLAEMEFAHIGLIFQNGKKMSKRDGSASLLEYMHKGYYPEALFSYMLRLGWSPQKDDKHNDILTRDEAVTMFLDQGKMRNTPANFDLAKLDNVQKQWKALSKGRKPKIIQKPAYELDEVGADDFPAEDRNGWGAQAKEPVIDAEAERLLSIRMNKYGIMPEPEQDGNLQQIIDGDIPRPARRAQAVAPERRNGWAVAGEDVRINPRIEVPAPIQWEVREVLPPEPAPQGVWGMVQPGQQVNAAINRGPNLNQEQPVAHDPLDF